MLYSCDGAWWKNCNGATGFQGLKLSQDSQACATYRDVHKIRVEVECTSLLLDEPGFIGAGGNSGFQALNIAVQFGGTRIILVGFDMHAAAGTHWHGHHANGLNNPNESNFVRWRTVFEGVAPKLNQAGIQIVNASPDSALVAFPKMTLEEAIDRWRL